MKLSDLPSLNNPNPKTKLCDSDRKVIMAIKLGINPNARHTWPIDIINSLLEIEDNNGDHTVVKEIQKLRFGINFVNQ